MEQTVRGTVLGILLGLLVAGVVVVVGFDWGVHEIKTVSLSVKPPLLFVPK